VAGIARALYVPVIYVEPSTAQNRGITGYDMLSEPIRREAIERARDSGHIALSARVTLMQDRHAFAPEPGLLLYLPIYHREAPTNDVPQRRAAIKGFVYVALHSENLFVGALVDELKDMRVQVFDGTRADPSKLLFATPQAASADGIKARKTINAAGRTWLLELQVGERFVSAQRQDHALVVALAALCAVLLFGVMSFITRTRDHAQAIARRMTAELMDVITALTIDLRGRYPKRWAHAR